MLMVRRRVAQFQERIRFVRYARDETAAATFVMLAECFETIGGVSGRDTRRSDGLPQGRNLLHRAGTWLSGTSPGRCSLAQEERSVAAGKCLIAQAPQVARTQRAVGMGGVLPDGRRNAMLKPITRIRKRDRWMEVLGREGLSSRIVIVRGFWERFSGRSLERPVPWETVTVTINGKYVTTLYQGSLERTQCQVPLKASTARIELVGSDGTALYRRSLFVPSGCGLAVGFVPPVSAVPGMRNPTGDFVSRCSLFVGRVTGRVSLEVSGIYMGDTGWPDGVVSAPVERVVHDRDHGLTAPERQRCCGRGGAVVGGGRPRMAGARVVSRAITTVGGRDRTVADD